MNVSIVSIKIEEKKTLANLLELYFQELSTFKALEVDEYGKFGYKYLDLYWQEKERLPFFIKVDGNISGFILINEHSDITPGAKVIAEFYVLKNYQRQGIGKQAAFKIFNKFPGEWEIAEMIENIPAQEFWRKIIEEYTAGRYTKIIMNNEIWKGPVQKFNNLIWAGK